MRRFELGTARTHTGRKIMAKWQLSSVHSVAEFTVRHMMVT